MTKRTAVLVAAVLVVFGAAAYGLFTIFSSSNGTTYLPGMSAASSSPPMTSSSPMMTTPKAKATAPSSAMMPSTGMQSSSPAPAMTPQCDASNTSVTLGMANGAAGTDYQTLVIKNQSMSPCVTGGYPGISLDSSMGTQLGMAAQRMGPAGSEVTLAPGAEATDIFSYGDAEVSTGMGCNPAPGSDIRVYLPDATGSVLVPFDRDGCTGSANYLNVWAVNVAPGS